MAEDIKTVSIITPAGSADVAFTDKVNAVDDALKSRADVTNALKSKWGEISEWLTEHDIEVPYRRTDAAGAHNLINKVYVYTAEDERLADKEKNRVAHDGAYVIENLLKVTRVMKYLEKQHYGFRKDLEELQTINDLQNEGRHIDEEATKAAKKELKALVKDYVIKLEEYDDTVNKVADVKEYVSVVKDVAEISAIAKGVQRPEER